MICPRTHLRTRSRTQTGQTHRLSNVLCPILDHCCVHTIAARPPRSVTSQRQPLCCSLPPFASLVSLFVSLSSSLSLSPCLSLGFSLCVFVRFFPSLAVSLTRAIVLCGLICSVVFVFAFFFYLLLCLLFPFRASSHTSAHTQPHTHSCWQCATGSSIKVVSYCLHSKHIRERHTPGHQNMADPGSQGRHYSHDDANLQDGEYFGRYIACLTAWCTGRSRWTGSRWCTESSRDTGSSKCTRGIWHTGS